MEQPQRPSEVSQPQEKTVEGRAGREGKLPLKLRSRISTLRRERTRSQSWMRPACVSSRPAWKSRTRPE